MVMETIFVANLPDFPAISNLAHITEKKKKLSKKSQLIEVESKLDDISSV